MTIRKPYHKGTGIGDADGVTVAHLITPDKTHIVSHGDAIGTVLPH